MKKRIPYPLSAETKPAYVKALKEVEKSKRKGGKVVDVTLSDDGEGNPVGIIVMDEPI
jgi:hypothetical protein